MCLDIKKLFVCPERNVRPSGGLLNKERAGRAGGQRAAGARGAAAGPRAAPRLRAGPPLRPGVSAVLPPAPRVRPAFSHLPLDAFWPGQERWLRLVGIWRP